MKKIGFFGLLMLFLLCFGVTASASLLSPAISVMQEEFEMIKTGVGSNTVSFSEEDFENVLGKSQFTSIEIKALPNETEGVLKLGMENVSVGDIIEREMLAALRFIPAAEQCTAVFHFLPHGTDYENPFVCTVYMLEQLNFSPTAKTTVLSAMEELPVYASLSAVDPDGDALTYHLETKPKSGTLTLSETGELVYRADAGSAGEDSFSYYVKDKYGNRSDAAVVFINTEENTSGIVYTDLHDSEYALSAVSLAEAGAFIGEKLGDECYFYPEKTVTRADFLMMAMKMCDIDASLFASDVSGFADSNTFSDTQNRYISTAAKLGLVIGLDTENGRCFCPDEVITSEQAATILARIAKLEGLTFGDAVAASISAEGELSDDGYAMLMSVGLVAGEERKAEVTRADAAKLLYTLISHS